MFSIIIFLLFMVMMILYHKILMFYISVCCLMSFFLLMSYTMINGEYMMMIKSYFGLDKYSFYMILLKVWIKDLMFMLFDEKDGLTLKITIFNIVLIILIMFFNTCNLLLMYLFFEMYLYSLKLVWFLLL